MDVSDSRGIHTRSNENVSKLNQVSSQNVSYAQAAQREIRPIRNQAIVMDSLDGLTRRDYALAIGEKIVPENMRYISRISHSRICIYLNSEENATKLIDTHKYVNINNTRIEIRPLISTSKRIIISNVNPTIPNTLIETKLAEFNITKKSQITELKTGLHDIGYTYLLCFKRQLYIDQEDVNKLPDSLPIVHENITYWIYISTKKLSCFICKATL